MKTRLQAAKELLPVYNSKESRKFKLQTLCKKMHMVEGVWRCAGVGYDYTV